LPRRRYLPVIIGLASIITSVYLLEFALQLILINTAKDEVAIVLKPFQNHYFSLSSPFVTTEGLASEFTDDPTAASRTFAFLVPGIAVWVALAAVLYLIKPLRKQHGLVVTVVGIVIFAVTLYSAFFVPPQKVSFSEKEMVVEDARWIVLRTSAHISYERIDRFEYEYFRTPHGYLVSNLLYSRIYAVLGSRRYLVGENQIKPDDGNASPSAAQEMEARDVVGILNRKIGKEADR